MKASLSQMRRAPRIVSSGFSTVDVLFDDGVVRAAPGGTAVNVARALQSMGWRSDFVGTIGTDPAGQFLRHELEMAGVGVSCLIEDDRWTTPVIVQESRRGDHHWRFSCPFCGAKFAKHRPTSAERAADLASTLGTPDVFFFDRSSLFTLSLAEIWASQGVLIFFEPAGLGRPLLFDRAAAASAIIKFSSDRMQAFASRLPESGQVLIETMGALGARFRLPRGSVWHQSKPNRVIKLMDTAGAGDWATAGLLDALFDSEGSRRALAIPELRVAVAEAQKYGAMACEWQGAYPDAFRMLPQDGFEPFGCPRVVQHERGQGRG